MVPAKSKWTSGERRFILLPLARKGGASRIFRDFLRFFKNFYLVICLSSPSILVVYDTDNKLSLLCADLLLSFSTPSPYPPLAATHPGFTPPRRPRTRTPTRPPEERAKTNSFLQKRKTSFEKGAKLPQVTQSAPQILPTAGFRQALWEATFPRDVLVENAESLLSKLNLY